MPRYCNQVTPLWKVNQGVNMILNSKMNYQRSVEKTNHRDTRNKPLPSISPEPLLEPDACPLAPTNPDYTTPLDPTSILSRLKTHSQPHQPKPTKPTKSLVLPSATNDNEISILSRLVVTTAELQRVTQQLQSNRRQHSEHSTLKNKYEDLLQRYKQGESSFYKLTERNKQLESQLKYASQVPENISSVKDSEIKNLKEQLKTAREVSQSNVNMLESSNKRLQSEKNQLRQLLDTSNSEKAKLENDQSLLKTNIFKSQDEIQKLSNQLSFTKQQLAKSQDESNRLLQSVSNLKEQLAQKDKFYQQNMNLQIAQYKQNADVYLTQCQRLSNQISRLNEKAALEFNNERVRTETELGLRDEIRRLRMEIEGLQRARQQLTSVKNQLQFSRSRNDGYEIEVNQLRVSNRQYSQRVHQLESEVRRLQHSRLDNSQLLINYEALTREREEDRLNNELQKSQMINRIKLLEKDVQQYEMQEKAKDGLIQKLNFQNNELRKEASSGKDADVLRKHLELSVEEMNRVYGYTRNIITELTGRVSWLSKEKQQFLKKQQYQEFELEKLYQVLKTRKQELQSCYRTIEGLRKGVGEAIPGQDLNELLRNRRQQLL